MATEQEKERLLRLLDAHGQQFLSAFNIPAAPKHKAKDSDGSEPEEEWAGFGSSPNRGNFEAASDSEHDGACNQSYKVPQIRYFRRLGTRERVG